MCISEKFPTDVAADAARGDPTLRTIVSSLGGLSNYFTSDYTARGCFLITFCHQVCLRSIRRLNRTFSGGQLLLKAVTVDLGHRTCPINKTLPAVPGCVVHSTIFLYIYIFPPLFSYSSLFFVKPLNFFTKSGCFGSEGLWRSNFLVQPFSLL